MGKGGTKLIVLSLAILGVLAILEAVIAMFWKANDRTAKAQAARGMRIAGGAYLIVIGAMERVPTMVVAVPTTILDWNGLTQTALNAVVVFFSVRYVGKVVDRVENRNRDRNGNGKDGKDREGGKGK